MDEVDFYFGPNFMGKTFNAVCQYQKPEIINIFLCIWKNKQNNLNFQQFQQYPEYKELYSNNPGLQQFKQLVDEKIILMLEDVQNMNNHQYFIYYNEETGVKLICYKQLDGVSVNMVKGFKTAFAYIQEWEKKVISEEIMKENLCLIFRLGCYSFAQIPKMYNLILGVSGTLEDMVDHEKQMIQDIFNIKKYTYVPSMFGISCKKDQENIQLLKQFNVRFDDDIFDEKKNICVEDDEQSYFQKIIEDIMTELKAGGAVLVFFEYIEKLKKCQSLLNTDYELQILTEQSNNKNYIISRTATQGMITLATSPFNRGCDFICSDPKLETRGLRVIMTYLSKQLSEQTQCKGRTARQFQKGTFQIIINKIDLIKHFQASKEENFKTNLTLSQRLNELRNQQIKNKQKMDQQQQKIQDAKRVHDSSVELKNLLIQFNNQKNQIQKIIEIIDILSKFNINEGNMINKYGGKYYNVLAGKIGIGQDVAELDKFNNPIGSQFDLGIDGAFEDFSIIIGCFYHGETVPQSIQKLCIPELSKKGYKKIELVLHEQDFIQKLPNFDEAWVISSNKFNNPSIQNEFVESILRHLQKQRGLMIWGDNEPFYVHANIILQRIPVGYQESSPIFIQLYGNDPGDQILKAGQNNQIQQFGPHGITTGLNEVHEGITICSPLVQSNTNKNNFGSLELIGLSSANKPCIFAIPGNDQRGRIVIDCGWTKLIERFWLKTAGTIRYVQNCAVWLTWTERLQEN